MKIRTIQSIFAKHKESKTQPGAKIYCGYDSVYYYPPLKYIWKYLRGEYSGCYYETSENTCGHSFHNKYDLLRDKHKWMRILVYIFYYLKLRTWIEK